MVEELTNILLLTVSESCSKNEKRIITWQVVFHRKFFVAFASQLTVVIFCRMFRFSLCDLFLRHIGAGRFLP